MSEKVKVVIRVDGGNVVDVCSGVPLDVIVVDHDNIEAGDTPIEHLRFEDESMNAEEFLVLDSTRGWY